MKINESGWSLAGGVFIEPKQEHTVDGSEIPRPTTWDVKDTVNNGIDYQPELVQIFSYNCMF